MGKMMGRPRKEVAEEVNHPCGVQEERRQVNPQQDQTEETVGTDVRKQHTGAN